MHNGFWVIHYQIYGFPKYLLVHLPVPEIFGPKSTLCVTNMPLEHFIQTCQYFSMPVAGEKKQKPWDRPYAPCTCQAPENCDASQTKAISKPNTVWEQLTLHNWLGVVQYFDSNQPISQEEVVKHFVGRSDGALIFSQSALSRHLSKKGCEEDQSRLAANQTALSGKRAQIITCTDVERALILWVNHMEEKLEHVTGAMLVAKRAKFEDQLGVPDVEQLKSNGWVQGFCKTYVRDVKETRCNLWCWQNLHRYKLKKFHRHGEAGSVDLEAVKKERKRVSEIVAQYAKHDCFNFDETGLFGL